VRGERAFWMRFAEGALVTQAMKREGMWAGRSSAGVLVPEAEGEGEDWNRVERMPVRMEVPRVPGDGYGG